MKLSDFNFIKSLKLFDEYINNTDIEIKNGEPDNIIDRGSKLIYYSPSSINKFLFNTWNVIARNHFNEEEINQLSSPIFESLMLYTNKDIPSFSYEKPFLIDFNKINIVSLIVRELIEPLIGNIPNCKVLFIKCNFTDSCRIIENHKDIEQYNLQTNVLSIHYPLLLVNYSIKNKSASYCHILIKYLDMFFGESKRQNIIKNLLLNEESNILNHIHSIYSLMEGDIFSGIEFVETLKLYADFNNEEYNRYNDINLKIAVNNKFIKNAFDNYNPQVFRQWSQWSLMLGLIEKQLSSMRGSMWPTTKKLKPHEDKLKEAMIEQAKALGKNILNMEEMLEVSRDIYNHNAIEPGKLPENQLKENRVWKI